MNLNLYLSLFGFLACSPVRHLRRRTAGAYRSKTRSCDMFVFAFVLICICIDLYLH